MPEQFIGEKKIKSSGKTKEKTPGGVTIMRVEFEDGVVEHFSDLMFGQVVSDESCDLTALRDKRMTPVVEIVLAAMREWGVKVGELPYFSALLNQSLQHNSDQALLKLVGGYMPKPLSLDEVDYVTIDRILKDEK